MTFIVSLYFIMDIVSLNILQIRKKIGFAKQDVGLFLLDLSTTILPQSYSLCTESTIKSNSSVPWHNRIGHILVSKLKLMSSQFLFLPNCNFSPCDVSHYAKQRKLQFSSSDTHFTQNFDILHVDICGPYSTSYIRGHRYSLTLVDEFSMFTWIILIKKQK